MEITIIGGGIAGLTTAIALRKIGIEARVIEATPEFKPVGAGLSLAANAIKAFKSLGIAESVIAAGKEIEALTIFDHKGRVISKANTRKLHAKYGLSNFSIHRANLHNVLYSFLEPQQVLTGKRSHSLEETKQGYKVDFTDGTSIETSCLIVADGIHSAIRKNIFPASHIRYAGYTCWRAVIKNESGITGTSETWGPMGRFGIVPLANDQVYWFATKSVDHPESSYKYYTPADLAHNFKNYHHPITDLIKATPAQDLLWNDIIDLEPMPAFAKGKLLFIGDAAHATTPNLGQGACMAIEDAVVLANCMKNNADIAQAFSQFETKRLKRTHTIVKGSWRMGRIAQFEDPMKIRMRNFMFRMIPDFVYEKQLEQLFQVSFE